MWGTQVFNIAASVLFCRSKILHNLKTREFKAFYICWLHSFYFNSFFSIFYSDLPKHCTCQGQQRFPHCTCQDQQWFSHCRIVGSQCVYLTRLLRTFNTLVLSILLKVPSLFHLICKVPLCWPSSHSTDPSFSESSSSFWNQISEMFLSYFFIYTQPLGYHTHPIALDFFKRKKKFINMYTSYIHRGYAEGKWVTQTVA